MWGEGWDVEEGARLFSLMAPGVSSSLLATWFSLKSSALIPGLGGV